MRATEPAASGVVERNGVGVYWEQFGSGEPAILFLGVDPIVSSRMWKGQVPWFARRHTVMTFDPPGNGRSSRTDDPNSFGDAEFVAHALAVLDAAGIERAVVVGLCQGAGIAIVMAAECSHRVIGVVAINPGLVLSSRHPHRRPGDFDGVLDSDEGWAKENRYYWLRDWAGYSDFFFAELLPEPHSSKQHEDCVGWALDTTPEIMLAYCFSDPPTARGDQSSAADLCRRVRCPVLVICGDQDMCQPPERSRAVAELTGGELVVFEGSGHIPVARDPVRVNLEIARFVRRIGFADRLVR